MALQMGPYAVQLPMVDQSLGAATEAMTPSHEEQTSNIESTQTGDAEGSKVDRQIDKALASHRPQAVTSMTASDRLALFNQAMEHEDFARNCIIYEPTNHEANSQTFTSHMLDQLGSSDEDIVMNEALTSKSSTPHMTQSSHGEGDIEMAGQRLTPGNQDLDALLSEAPADTQPLVEATQRASATAPSYEEACQLLGLSPESPILTIPGQVFPTRLKPWQVTGIAWMVLRERSPIKGGILGDACGLGKTFTALSLVYLASHLQHEQEKAPTTHRPTLILCPGSLIQSWVNEIWTRFRNGLIVCVFSRDKIYNPGRFRIIKTFEELKEKIHGVDTRQISTDRTIFLASYDRWSHHTVEEKQPAEEPELAVPEESSDQDGITDAEDNIAVSKHKEKSKETANPKIYETIFKGRFHRVILDEGHMVKTIGTRRHHSVAKLEAYHYWFVAATPMMNKVLDLCGYLDILYREEFDIPGRTVKGRPDELLAEFENCRDRADLEQNPPLHLLAPQRLAMLADKGHFSSRCGMHVLPVLLKMICLARCADDDAGGLVLAKTIGDDIPPVRVMTIELKMWDHLQKTHNAVYFQDLVDHLHTGAVEHMGKIQESAGRMNPGIHRRLMHLGFSPLVETCIQSAGKSVWLLELLSRDINAKSDDLGFHLFWRWSTADLRPDFDVSDYCPSTPSDRAWYLIEKCPKLRYIMKILHSLGYCSTEQTPLPRVIILCRWPVVLWVLQMFMSFIGIPYVTIRSSMPQDSRLEALDMFTSNKRGGPRVLLTTYHYGAMGLNLQSACANMILVEQPGNTNVIFHCIGRVHRLGQRQKQRVWILFQDHTIDRYIAFNNTRKIIPQIAAIVPNIQQAVIAGPSLHGRNDDAMEISDSSGNDVTETGIQHYVEGTLMQMLGQTRSRLGMGRTNSLGLPRSFQDEVEDPFGRGKRKRVSGEVEASKRHKGDEGDERAEDYVRRGLCCGQRQRQSW